MFVEVRYRRGDRFGGAAASVDASKQRRVAAAAEHYLARRVAGSPPRCRFDVVAVTGPVEAPRVRWLRGAFDADR